MSGPLFHVKTSAIVGALRTHKDKIEARVRDAFNYKPVGPDDGKIRMVMQSPEVSTEVKRKFPDVKFFRIRFAFDVEAPTFGLDHAYLEVYDTEGNPVTEPIEAPDLDAALGNAVQVELFHFLLKQRDLDIPML
jgi:hypothetical protein